MSAKVCQWPACIDGAEFRVANPLTGLPDLELCGKHVLELEDDIRKFFTALKVPKAEEGLREWKLTKVKIGTSGEK